ncbi:MAG: YncE family protein [Flavobacteriales bacterium]|nr:YncE family protein [Flavobacteriales bacterium]
MNRGAKIGLTATAAFAGLAWWLGRDKTSKPEDKTVLEKKTYDSGDDSFVGIINERLKAVLTPSNIRFEDQHKADLKKWGTKEGVIDTARDIAQKKKEKKKADAIEKAGKAFVKHNLPKLKIKQPGKKESTLWQKTYHDLLKEYSKTQVVITNTSTEAKFIRLWGANRPLSISPPAPADVEDHIIEETVSLAVGVHPQGIAYNPFNDLVYVADQLSGTVTVIDRSNLIVKTVQLQPSFPGFSSPVAVTVNHNTGYAYVAGSISDTVSVIDTALNVAGEIPVGTRPVSLAWNPKNNFIYVASLVDDNLTVINAFDNSIVTTLPAGDDPIDVAVHPVTGFIYVVNSGSDDVSIYDDTNTPVATLPLDSSPVPPVIRPVSVAFDPLNNNMYVAGELTATAYVVDTALNTVSTTVPTGPKPQNLFFNTSNGFIYVQNSGDNTLTVIQSDNTIKDTLAGLGNQSTGGVFNPANGLIYVSDSTLNTVNAIGYEALSSSITIDSDYKQKLENFQHTPALVQHARFVLSGIERIALLKVNDIKPTGSVSSKPVSFSNYFHPQNFLNVSEVHELGGEVIDGRHEWVFKIPALQTLTVLVWYKQFFMNYLIPKPKNQML